jgi:3-hydroxyisobutyrate dehydrogenase-like beta-hydroxyacid dehydrogenase
VSKTSIIETPKPAKQRTSSVRSTEKPEKKVPEAKRKATRESEDNAKEEEMDIEEPPTAKKARKSNNASITTPTAAASARNASTSSSGGGGARRSDAGTEKALKSPRRSAVVESSGEIYGIIGLGIMGTSILKKLIESGHEVVIFNRTSSRCDEFTGSPRCTIVSTPREVFEQAHITYVCVSDCDAVKEVVCDGALGIIAADTGITDKGLVMFSSIDLETTADIQNAMMIKGSVRYLEAQIQGSRESAQNAELIIIASGDRSLYDDSKKCFDAIAKNTYFLSEEIGVAIKMNLVLQTIAGVQLAALGEALSLADTLGLQQRDILEIISLSNLNSEFIYQKGEVITNEKYREPSMKVDTMQKDMKMAIEFGDSLEQPLPLVAASKELFKSAKRMGFGHDDSAAIYYATNFNKYCYDLGNAYENGTTI